MVSISDDAGGWLAVGLGNPGERYERTRHNAGARAVEQLAATLGGRLRPAKGGILIAEARSEGARLVLGRPQSYMNDSGPPVAWACRWHRMDADHLIVLHDDIDLPPATLRLKKGGGTAGHRGLDSIVQALGSKDFYRVRIGVGRPDWPRDPVDWVLERMPKQTREELGATEAEAGDAVLSIIHDGLERAMNRFNTR
ncbi:MAG: aminoacyl-tRNA hydrolase [Actinomycetota bacterium]